MTGTVLTDASASSTRTLAWTRSTSSSVSQYRVEQQIDGGAWDVLCFVRNDARRWSFAVDTEVLDDLGSYAWRVVPIDGQGNAEAAVSIGAQRVVRTPDAPRFTIAFNPGASSVTFGEV